MSRRIIIQELVVSAKIGHLAGEREISQPVALDLRLDVDWTNAARSKNLNETVCYATVCADIRKLVESQQWLLLEELSEAVQIHIFKHYPLVSAVALRVKKFAVPGTDWVAVESEHHRNAAA